MECNHGMNTIVLIGGLALGRTPYDGETMKNQLFLERFQQLGYKVIAVDTLHWSKRPWVMLQLLWVLFRYKDAKFVISASLSCRHLIHFIYRLPVHYCYYDWAIGGGLADHISNGRYSIAALSECERVIVEGERLAKQLRKFGLSNVVTVSNFKPVDYHPILEERNTSAPFRFVFLSRIIADKGIPEIFQAVKILLDGKSSDFIVDFYGIVDMDYEKEFNESLAEFANVNYRGFLDFFKDEKAYEVLSSYDCMLFPTYWKGEGFPGIVIDASIAGLPLIATDWNLNRDYIKDGETGYLIPIHDAARLAAKMEQVMSADFGLLAMRRRCVTEAQQYDYRNVISKELMQELGFND